jgi:hypothetical protein
MGYSTVGLARSGGSGASGGVGRVGRSPLPPSALERWEARGCGGGRGAGGIGWRGGGASGRGRSRGRVVRRASVRWGAAAVSQCGCAGRRAAARGRAEAFAQALGQCSVFKVWTEPWVETPLDVVEATARSRSGASWLEGGGAGARGQRAGVRRWGPLRAGDTSLAAARGGRQKGGGKRGGAGFEACAAAPAAAAARTHCVWMGWAGGCSQEKGEGGRGAPLGLGRLNGGAAGRSTDLGPMLLGGAACPRGPQARGARAGARGKRACVGARFSFHSGAFQVRL